MNFYRVTNKLSFPRSRILRLAFQNIYHELGNEFGLCINNRLPNKDRGLQQQEQKGQLVPDQEQKQNQQQQQEK